MFSNLRNVSVEQNYCNNKKIQVPTSRLYFVHRGNLDFDGKKEIN